LKSLRTLAPAGSLVLALLGPCISIGTASGQDSKGRLSSWGNLKSLTPGQEIRVVVRSVKSYQGKFESLSDSGITLRQAGGEQTLARKDVFRVSRKGQDHHAQNALFGAILGAGAGLVIGLSPYYIQRNCTLGPAFNCGYPPNAHWVKVLTPLGGVGGFVVGALIPSGGWHDVYRAH